MGPFTGRGTGFCKYGLGWRGLSRPGRGLGGYYCVYDLPESKEDKKQALTTYKKALEEELEDIRLEEEKLNK